VRLKYFLRIVHMSTANANQRELSMIFRPVKRSILSK
jgi:hypothetical protein